MRSLCWCLYDMLAWQEQMVDGCHGPEVWLIQEAYMGDRDPTLLTLDQQPKPAPSRMRFLTWYSWIYLTK